MPQDYYAVLAALVGSSAVDDPKKRRAIYALAKGELRQNLARQRISSPHRELELDRFEAAINRIERELGQSSDRPLTVIAPAIEILPPERPFPTQAVAAYVLTSKSPGRGHWLTALCVVAVLALIIYLAVDRRLPYGDILGIGSPNGADDSRPTAQLQASSQFPTPTAYGAYALANRRLIELTPIAITVPNRLVPISISLERSQFVRLPPGSIQFVVFRRDMASNAPEKIHVRRVTAAMRPPSDLTAASTKSNSWTISNTYYEMNVSPMDANPAMILVRAATPDFAFPVGRYALVIKSTAYSFSVDDGVGNVGQ
jgi:hypothetical protein